MIYNRKPDGGSICLPRSKRSRSRSIGSLLLVGVFLLPAWGWGQDSQTGQPQPMVNVGVSTAKPGDIIEIPLTLSAPDTTNLTSIVETISFPKETLSLTKAELGLAGEQSKAEVKTDFKQDAASPDTALLVVTISSKEPIRPGILVYLKLKVAKTAKKSTVVLKIVGSKETTTKGKTLEASKGKNGEVTIFNANEQIPVVGCFFFTH